MNRLKTVIISLIVLFSSVSVVVHAEPQAEFRGLKLGESPPDYLQLVAKSDADSTESYNNPADILLISDIPIKGIIYTYYKKHLLAVSINGDSKYSNQMLKELIKQYGEGYHMLGSGEMLKAPYQWSFDSMIVRFATKVFSDTSSQHEFRIIINSPQVVNQFKLDKAGKSGL